MWILPKPLTFKMDFFGVETTLCMYCQFFSHQCYHWFLFYAEFEVPVFPLRREEPKRTFLVRIPRHKYMHADFIDPSQEGYSESNIIIHVTSRQPCWGTEQKRKKSFGMAVITVISGFDT